MNITKGITFLTAHQLSTEAQNLSKDSPVTFTKKVCTGGWYANCRSLHQKLDLEFVCHIVNHIDGNKYLMASRGKNRYSATTPIVDQHFVYKFQEFGGIVPDSGSDDMSLRKLPAVNDLADISVWED